MNYYERELLPGVVAVAKEEDGALSINGVGIESLDICTENIFNIDPLGLYHPQIETRIIEQKVTVTFTYIKKL